LELGEKRNCKVSMNIPNENGKETVFWMGVGQSLVDSAAKITRED